MKFDRDHVPPRNNTSDALFFLQWVELRGERLPHQERCVYRFTARIGWADRLLYIGRSNHGGSRIESHYRRWVHPLSVLSGVRIDTSALTASFDGCLQSKQDVAAAENFAHSFYPPILEGAVATHIFPDQRERLAVVSAMLRHDKEEWARHRTTSYEAAFDPMSPFPARREAVHRASVDLRRDIEWTLRWCENPNGGDKPDGFAKKSERPHAGRRKVQHGIDPATMYPPKDEVNGVGREV